MQFAVLFPLPVSPYVRGRALGPFARSPLYSEHVVAAIALVCVAVRPWLATYVRPTLGLSWGFWDRLGLRPNRGLLGLVWEEGRGLTS